MKVLHNLMASGVQASCCSGVPSVPWLNATEVAILKAALKKAAAVAKRLTLRSCGFDGRYRDRGSHRWVRFNRSSLDP
jgi:hypothetical protein